jgi:hypothetical protein
LLKLTKPNAHVAHLLLTTQIGPALYAHISIASKSPINEQNQIGLGREKPFVSINLSEIITISLKTNFEIDLIDIFLIYTRLFIRL